MTELFIRIVDGCFILTWALATGWSLFGSREARQEYHWKELVD